MSTGEPDFEDLNEAEQREVAERLLRIEQSGWRPFWCKRKDCNGSPHILPNALGAHTRVHDTAQQGPKGEPVGDLYRDKLTKTERVITDPSKVHDTDEFMYRVALDPTWAHNHAREDQRLPVWGKPWTLFIMSGRGSGKTRTGVEFVTLSARKGLDGAIIGRRGTELVNTHVAEIIAAAHPEFVPVHYASKDMLVWPNGAKTFLFSAERPENIRSVNVSYLWFDEAAFMDEIEKAWMNARMALRIEKPNNPLHTLITSTPNSTKWVMEKEDDPDIEVRRVSTYANKANLSRDYIADLVKTYEGTRMGRQEIHGEVLRDVEGALWNDGMFQHERHDAAGFQKLLEAMDEIVIGVDPAGSKTKRSDETGIMAVGSIHNDEHGNPLPVSRYFVLADATIKGTPTEWARQTFKLAQQVGAHRIIAEKNFGGDMVKQVLGDFAAKFPLEAEKDGESLADVVSVVHAVQGKETRAEAVVGKYEQGRVTHVTSPGVFGDLSELEKEQVTWVPRSRGGKMASPNRIDAMVWAVKQLETAVKYKAVTASRSDVMDQMKRPVSQSVSATALMNRLRGGM